MNTCSNDPQAVQINSVNSDKTGLSQSDLGSGLDCSEEVGSRSNNPESSYLDPNYNLPNCYKTCNRGSLGDTKRKLAVGLISERGIELYENYGMNTDYQETKIVTSDKRVSNQPTYYNDVVLQSQVVQNWGRKVCLFGSIEYSLFAYNYPVPIRNYANDRETFAPYCSFAPDPNADPLMECIAMKKQWQSNIGGGYAMNVNMPMLSNWVMRIQFDSPSYRATDYTYFGRSAVEITSFNGKVYVFNESDLNIATRIYKYRDMYYYYSFFDSKSRTFWIDATFWFLDMYIEGNVFTPPSNYFPDPKPESGNTVPTIDGVIPIKNNTLITPVPVAPVSHCYDGTGNSASGYKSMYVPPHMEIQAYTQSRFNMDSNTWLNKSDFSSYLYVLWRPNPNLISQVGESTVYKNPMGNNKNWIPPIYKWRTSSVNIFTDLREVVEGNEKFYGLPIQFQNAREGNGVFTFGTNLPNSLQKAIALNPSWLSLVDSGNYTIADTDSGLGYGFAGGIYTGALIGVKARVITSGDFLKYLGPTSIADYFMPEIVLNPSFKNGTSYITRLPKTPTDPPYVFNSTQVITSVKSFWTPANPDYENGYCNIDEKYKPWDVIPPPMSLGQTATSTSNPPRRIKSFYTPGIYSVEWLYVLFNCGTKCQTKPSYSNGKYQSTCTKTKADVPLGGSTVKAVDCCNECMLFVDPFNIINTGSSKISSASDTFMLNYCGLRNLTYYYAAMMPQGRNILQNECSCATSVEFCPSQFNASCTAPADVNSEYYYRPQYQINSNCNGAVTEQFCNSQVLQVSAALQGGSNTDNVNFAYNANCGEAVAPTKPKPTEIKKESSIYKKIFVLIFAMVILSVIVIVVALLYKKGSGNKGNI